MQEALNIVPSGIAEFVQREQDIGYAKGLLKGPGMCNAQLRQHEQDLEEARNPTPQLPLES